MRYSGMPTDKARALQAGGPDAYGAAPERALSDGGGLPCRHCLKNIPEGAPYLILAHRPFGAFQPYAETGPVFLCADTCAAPDGTFPEVLTSSPDYLLKGYSADERIVYGTGAITARDEIDSYAAQVLARGDIAFVDVRSARNNCWQVRITP
ncbi:DUF1203 domain-containing protein [Roseobacteraceae bacterium S113]